MTNESTPVRVFTLTTSTAPLSIYFYPPAATNTQRVEVPQIETDDNTSAAKIADAIYGHVQAVRALGRKEISVAEVARALGLTDADVVRALPLLRTKGVKAP